MKIQVKCSCGKVLYVPDEYAGKRGRCPQCARMLTIPKNAHPPSNTPPPKVCPTCGAYLSQEDEVCVTCQTNLKTGLWNMVEKTTPPPPFSIPKRYIIIAGVVGGALLVFAYCMGVWWSKESFETQWKKALAHIQAMPQNNEQEIADQLEAIQALRQQFPDYVTQSESLLHDLQQKIRPSLDWDNLFYIAEQEKNLLVRCWYWQLLQKYPNNQQLQVEQKLATAHQQLNRFLREQQGEVHQLYREKRWQEILTRITPKILKMMQESIGNSSELNQSWEDLCNAYQKPLTDDPNTSKPPRTPLNNAQLEKYEQQFPSLVIRFEQMMLQRDYQSAQQILENFWQGLQQMEGLTSDTPLLVQVRQRLKEVQSVKALFSIANEGAKANVGITKVIFYKDGRTLVGRIIQYVAGQFYLQEDTGNVSKIPLKDIQAEEIVFFASNVQKSRYVYEYAGIFYLYEQNFTLAQQSFVNALKAGSDAQEIQRYLKQIREAVVKHRSP